ncbi:MAG: hypothetical protein AB1Z22_01870 [Synechococcaceae cyanobacterium]
MAGGKRWRSRSTEAPAQPFQKAHRTVPTGLAAGGIDQGLAFRHQGGQGLDGSGVRRQRRLSWRGSETITTSQLGEEGSPQHHDQIPPLMALPADP